jgi:hypothetical protein
MKNLNWLGKGALRVSKVRKAVEYARQQRASVDIERALECALEAGLVLRLSADDLGRVLLAIDTAYTRGSQPPAK